MANAMLWCFCYHQWHTSSVTNPLTFSQMMVPERVIEDFDHFLKISVLGHGPKIAFANFAKTAQAFLSKLGDRPSPDVLREIPRGFGEKNFFERKRAS